MENHPCHRDTQIYSRFPFTIHCLLGKNPLTADREHGVGMGTGAYGYPPPPSPFFSTLWPVPAPVMHQLSVTHPQPQR